MYFFLVFNADQWRRIVMRKWRGWNTHLNDRYTAIAWSQYYILHGGSSVGGGGLGKPAGVYIVGSPICTLSVLKVKIADIRFVLHGVFGIKTRPFRPTLGLPHEKAGCFVKLSVGCAVRVSLRLSVHFPSGKPTKSLWVCNRTQVTLMQSECCYLCHTICMRCVPSVWENNCVVKLSIGFTFFMPRQTAWGRKRNRWDRER